MMQFPTNRKPIIKTSVIPDLIGQVNNMISPTANLTVQAAEVEAQVLLDKAKH
jgi:hypothetical protein